MSVEWVKLRAGEFLNGVFGLKPGEGWVYTIIIMMIYEHRGPVKIDIENLARRCRMSTARCRAAVHTLYKLEKISDNHGSFENQTCTRVLDFAYKNSIDNSDNAYKRWDKTKEKQHENDAVASSGAVRQKVPIRREKNRIDIYIGRFVAEYPKRDGSQNWKQARLRFAKFVSDGVDPEIIVSAAKRYRSECERKRNLGTEFVAQAATWLSQERWKEYPEPMVSTVPMVAVADGSQAMLAWERHRGKTAPRTTVEIAGRLVSGWRFPTEFPPEEPGSAAAPPTGEAAEL